MKIEQLQIGGFGALAGEYAFSPGLNIVCAPNEAGKTTLSAALLSLLYGTRNVIGKRRQATDDERRYRPFTGDTFALGGTLALRSGRRLNVWRDFSSDLCRVVDLAPGKDISSDFSRAPNGDMLGQKLLGLTRTQFEKIAYIRQDQASRERDFAEFSDTLSALFASEDGQGGTIQKALQALEQALTRYDGVSGKGMIRVDTEISRLTKRLEEIESTLRDCEEQRQRTEAAFAEVAEQSERSAALEREIRAGEYLAGLARLQELQQARNLRLKARENIEKINLQILELSAFRDLDYSQGDALASCAAVLRDREERLRENGLRLGQTQAGSELLQKRFEESGNLAEADADILRRTEIALSRLGEVERRESSARIDLQSAAAALRVEGGDPATAEKFYRWLDGLGEADRRYLADYPDKSAAAEKGLALLATKRAELEKDRLKLEHRRLTGFKQWRMNMFAGLFLFLISVVAFFAMDLLWFLVFPPLICVGFGVVSLMKMSRSNNLDRPEEERINREFSELYARENALDRQRQELAARRDELSALYPEGTEAFQTAQELLHRCRSAAESWRQIHGRMRELQLTGCEQAQELLNLLKEYSPPTQAGHGTASLPEATDLPGVMEKSRRFLLELKEMLSLQQQQRQSSAALQDLQKQHAILELEIRDQRARLEEILLAGGLQSTADPASALTLYHENGIRQRRLHELEEQTLPSAIAAAGDEHSLLELSADIAALDTRLAQVRMEHPWLQSLRAEAAVADYEARAQAARSRLKDDSQALAERERAMALELERYQDQVPALLAERESLLQAQSRAVRYQKAMLIAGEVMSGVAGELHARWSPLLAQELAGIVRRFSERWRFRLSSDLRLTVSPQAADGASSEKANAGILLDDEGLALHLSAGMKDQAYLALRLLLAGKLGGSEPLPLILDDPFVNADDNRFREGMEYLAEIAGEHQIFVFSCHESRHDALVAARPDLFSALLRL